MGDPLARRPLVRELNDLLICKVCNGYLVDATKVIECLHTFCKSCIVKHLQYNFTCPECQDVIHHSHPLHYIAFDRTLQDLVYKIVPGLEKNESKCERDFYRHRGLPCPKDEVSEQKDESKDVEMTPNANTNTDTDFHRFDEQVNILLECKLSDQSSSLHSGDLNRKFIRCSSLATVTHLKKFISQKLLNCSDRFKDIEIFCDEEPLFKDHTLKFINVTKWRTKDPPLKLIYVLKTGYED